MKHLVLFALVCATTTLSRTGAEPAPAAHPPSTIVEEGKELCENGQLKCYQTEYKSYVKCVEKQRSKRNICNFAQSMAPVVVPAVSAGAQPCTGQSCTYIDMCQGASCAPPVQPQIVQQQQLPNVAPQVVVPPQLIQPQAIQPQPQPQSIITIPAGQQQQQQAPVIIHPASPNVTTIIKLTNIVNNTNLVNVTTTLNNTNVNNLELGTNATALGGGGEDGGRVAQAQRDRCCTVVQPRVCHRVSDARSGYRCVHRRHMTCGEQCTADTVHAQVRQPCDGPAERCPAQVAYVPQPTPRCTYQADWPYVSCSAARHQRRSSSCEGCYDHYGYGFERYHAGAGSPPDCAGCHDDGLAPGGLYPRHGPFYRPGYYHAPPCYVTGSCYMMMQPPQQQPMPCGYGGCFGHELVDPAFGAASYSPYAPYYGGGGGYYQQPQPYYQQSYYQQPQPYYQQPPQPYYYPSYSWTPPPTVAVNVSATTNGTTEKADENAIVAPSYYNDPYYQQYRQYYAQYAQYYNQPQFFYPDAGVPSPAAKNETEDATTDEKVLVEKKKK